MTDEGEPISMCRAVDSVIAISTVGLGQQTFTLLVADGFDLSLGQFRKITDLHAATPKVKPQRHEAGTQSRPFPAGK